MNQGNSFKIKNINFSLGSSFKCCCYVFCNNRTWKYKHLPRHTFNTAKNFGVLPFLFTVARLQKKVALDQIHYGPILTGTIRSRKKNKNRPPKIVMVLKRNTIVFSNNASSTLFILTPNLASQEISDAYVRKML